MVIPSTRMTTPSPALGSHPGEAATICTSLILLTGSVPSLAFAALHIRSRTSYSSIRHSGRFARGGRAVSRSREIPRRGRAPAPQRRGSTQLRSGRRRSRSAGSFHIALSKGLRAILWGPASRIVWAGSIPYPTLTRIRSGCPWAKDNGWNARTAKCERKPVPQLTRPVQKSIFCRVAAAPSWPVENGNSVRWNSGERPEVNPENHAPPHRRPRGEAALLFSSPAGFSLLPSLWIPCASNSAVHGRGPLRTMPARSPSASRSSSRARHRWRRLHASRPRRAAILILSASRRGREGISVSSPRTSSAS
jgi:hypothetical protein